MEKAVVCFPAMRAAVAVVVVALATIALAASGRVTLEQGKGGEIVRESRADALTNALLTAPWLAEA